VEDGREKAEAKLRGVLSSGFTLNKKDEIWPSDQLKKNELEEISPYLDGRKLENCVR